MTILQNSNEVEKGALLLPSFRQKLGLLIAEYGLKNERLVQIARAASKGRVRSMAGITEFDAMLIWHIVQGVQREEVR